MFCALMHTGRLGIVSENNNHIKGNTDKIFCYTMEFRNITIEENSNTTRERQKWCSKHLQTWNTQTVTEQQSVKPSWMPWNPSSLGKNGWNSLRRSTSRKSVAGSESRSKRCCACISCRTGSVSRTRESRMQSMTAMP